MERADAKIRVNNILFGRFERWALPRMAKRLPAWMTPDKLTLVGIAAAFGVGEKETMITTLDADGVALAAIQGLYEMVKEQQERIAALEWKLAELAAKEGT